jgi:hypothetical protein
MATAVTQRVREARKAIASQAAASAATKVMPCTPIQAASGLAQPSTWA